MTVQQPIAYIKAGPLNNYVVVSYDRKGQKTETPCHNFATAKLELARLK